MTDITGYELAKRVNDKLSDHSIKPIPPQMIYNYLKQGMITGEYGTGQMITEDQANDFLGKYLPKKIAKETQK